MPAFFDQGRYLLSQAGLAADRQYLGQCYRFDPATARIALPPGARLANDRIWIVWWWLGGSPREQQAGAFVEIERDGDRLLHRLIPFGGQIEGRSVRARSILHETRSSALIHVGEQLLVAAIAHPEMPPHEPLLGEAETVMRMATLDDRGRAVFDSFWRDSSVVHSSECIGALHLTPLALKAGLPPPAEVLGAVRFLLRSNASAAHKGHAAKASPRVERQAALGNQTAREYFATALDLESSAISGTLPPVLRPAGGGPAAWLVWWRDFHARELVESALVMPVSGPQGAGVYVVRHFGPPCSLPRIKPKLSAAPGLIVATVHDGESLLAMAATAGEARIDDSEDTTLFDQIVACFKGVVYDDEGHGFLCPVWRDGQPILNAIGGATLHLGDNWSADAGLPNAVQAIGALSMTVRPMAGSATVN